MIVESILSTAILGVVHFDFTKSLRLINLVTYKFCRRHDRCLVLNFVVDNFDVVQVRFGRFITYVYERALRRHDRPSQMFT